MLLNKIQYFLQKPWRVFLKRPSRFKLFLNRYLFPVVWAFKLVLYVLLTPLRFINAFYYNIVIHSVWTLRDHWLEIFAPKLGKMRHRRGFVYGFFWLILLPWRIVKYGVSGLVKFIEGFLFVTVDTFLPALTMYHGTQKGASISIARPGKWLVGSGNFAGSGIYFAMNKSVALHYAGRTSDSVMIVARVTPGRIINLNLTPRHIRNLVASDGDKITQWGMSKMYSTAEWWRTTGGWWEYCLFRKRDGRYFRTWRIRILYVVNTNTNKVERIWGGKSFWMF